MPRSTKPIRALSLNQPFAEMVLRGEKLIEYRSRQTHIRERVYIYATKGMLHPDLWPNYGFDYDRDILPQGFLVGTVEIVDCTEGNGEYEWHLARPKRLRTPIAPTGVPQPGFFRPFKDA